MAKVPVFISYHGSDLDLASRLMNSLKRLSSDFEVFLDKYSIRPSEDYEQTIANEIAKAEWFLIVCTGFPHRDADMLWSFFEAGQFRATLPDTLSGVSGRRIVCLFDTEPPTVLSRFHGVKVEPRQLNGSSVDVDARPPSANEQLDVTAIRGLLRDMLANAPLDALRDMADDSTRGMLREEAYNLIKAFEVTDPGKRIDEKTLQPRISFELSPGEALTAGTRVKGYEQSLRTLFGIESNEATWGRVSSEAREERVKPVWICDVETAAASIMKDKTPDLHANKCVLRDTIYTAFVARYEIFKDRKRVIYVAFLPASKKNFDMTRRSSMILSALILTTRFREQVIPQGVRMAGSVDVAGDVAVLLQKPRGDRDRGQAVRPRRGDAGRGRTAAPGQPPR